MKSLYGIEVQNVMDAILHKRDLAKKTNRNLDSEVQEGTLAVEKKGDVSLSVWEVLQSS